LHPFAAFLDRSIRQPDKGYVRQTISVVDLNFNNHAIKTANSAGENSCKHEGIFLGVNFCYKRLAGNGMALVQQHRTGILADLSRCGGYPPPVQFLGLEQTARRTRRTHRNRPKQRNAPIQYWIAHPSSRLTNQQKADFIQGLQATIK
jgi:hypothetical protein